MPLYLAGSGTNKPIQNWCSLEEQTSPTNELVVAMEELSLAAKVIRALLDLDWGGSSGLDSGGRAMHWSSSPPSEELFLIRSKSRHQRSWSTSLASPIACASPSLCLSARSSSLCLHATAHCRYKSQASQFSTTVQMTGLLINYMVKSFSKLLKAAIKKILSSNNCSLLARKHNCRYLKSLLPWRSYKLSIVIECKHAGNN